MKVFFLTGHTASGKTNLIFSLFEHFYFKNKENTIVINSDAYQVYKDIKLISTQPDFQEFFTLGSFLTEKSSLRIEDFFLLYNKIEPDVNLSVVEMINLIKEEIIKYKDKQIENIIITGGSPMYMRLLIDGFEEKELISLENLDKISNEYDLDSEKVYNELMSYSNLLFDKIKLNDKKRVINYLANYRYGKPENVKKKENFQNFIQTIFKENVEIFKFLLYKDREFLYRSCEKRFDILINKGVLTEVADFLEKIKKIHNYESLTSFQALGIKDIKNFLDDKISKNVMIEDVKRKTRRYIKHQDTWYKNKFNDFKRILNFEEILSYIVK